jgi:carbon-monoxide dehydrogenase small subunit
MKREIENGKREINFTIQDRGYRLNVAPGLMLVDLLRDKLHLTGTKVGCRRGECGACTVLINGKPILSCIFPAVRAHGKEITTIEGLKIDFTLHPLQEEFINQGAVQCGFCTPGMIMSSKAFLDENPHPSGYDIKEALSGNLCRCGGYQKIFKAVSKAANRMRKCKS